MRSRLLSLLVASLLPGVALSATDTATTCPSPQSLGPAVALMSNFTGQPALAWNGADFGALWIDTTTSQVRFQRVYADGSVAAPSVVVGSSSYANTTALAWNGNGYGALWSALVGAGYSQIYFARLDANGAVQSGPTRISAWGNPNPTNSYYNGSLATSGNGYLATYTRSAADNDIYGTILDGAGNVVYGDFPIAAVANNQDSSSVAWSPTAGRYVVAWSDGRSGVRFEIYTAHVTPVAAVSVNGAVVSSSGYSYAPFLAATGNNLGLAWQDTRDGNYEAYFTTLNGFGQKTGSDTRQTFDGNYTYQTRAFWTGGEFGTFFLDGRSGSYELWYQREALNGSPVNGNTQDTFGVGIQYFAAAFAAHGYLTIYASSIGLVAQPWGCNYPYAPACPEAPDAYGISGSGATIAWLPVIDNYTDTAYYQVYRNDALVGTTSRTFWNDTGLSPNTTYQYNIRAVNAADLVSTPCPGSQIYVKSSAALALSVGKTSTDVTLAWTDSNGQNTYRVMRGTSPQVMTQIDSTSATSDTDHNAAIGNVCYFYSIDVPQ